MHKYEVFLLYWLVSAKINRIQGRSIFYKLWKMMLTRNSEIKYSSSEFNYRTMRKLLEFNNVSGKWCTSLVPKCSNLDVCSLVRIVELVAFDCREYSLFPAVGVCGVSCTNIFPRFLGKSKMLSCFVKITRRCGNRRLNFFRIQI